MSDSREAFDEWFKTQQGNAYNGGYQFALAAWRFRDAEIAEIAELRRENERLKRDAENYCSVMIAAAEEIHEHWEAHCDSEGYGPANLLRRLENCIPAEYAYKAGTVSEMQKRIDDAKLSQIAAEEERELLRHQLLALQSCEVDAARYRWLRANKHWALLVGESGFGFTEGQVEHWTNERNESLVDDGVDAGMVEDSAQPLPGEPHV